MEKQINPNDAIDFIIKHGNEFAVAKSNRVFIEQYLKVVKAKLMNDCANMPSTKAEAYADRKSTRLNSSHSQQSRMPSSA